jgi:hypothetical protein
MSHSSLRIFKITEFNCESSWFTNLATDQIFKITANKWVLKNLGTTFYNSLESLLVEIIARNRSLAYLPSKYY